MFPHSPLRFAASLLALALAACESPSSESPSAETPAPEPEITEPAEPPAYVGTWAFEPEWCTAEDDRTPIAITETGLRGYENTCEFTEITQTPEGGWQASLSCVSEGQTEAERIVMTPVGEELAITYLDREGAEPGLFHRCGS